MFVLKIFARNFQLLNASKPFQQTQFVSLHNCALMLSKKCSTELSPIKVVVKKKKRKISSSSEEETKEETEAALKDSSFPNCK